MRNVPFIDIDALPVQGLNQHRSRAHFHHPISRRALMKGTAGLGVAGALGVAFGGLRPLATLAAAPGSGVPNPISGGLDIGGTIFHVKLPGLVHSADDEPASITDFNGAIAFAVIDGMGARTQLSTGETAHLPFELDMRFERCVRRHRRQGPQRYIRLSLNGRVCARSGREPVTR